MTDHWQQYQINLSAVNLSRVIGGFGWAAAQQDNPSGATFYLDDIRYELTTPGSLDTFISAPSEPDSAAILAAHTYDNALVLLAFLSHGTPCLMSTRNVTV